ncbi:hypothetical protein VaNZ11_006714, partial [Volvox africanus]
GLSGCDGSRSLGGSDLAAGPTATATGAASRMAAHSGCAASRAATAPPQGLIEPSELSPGLLTSLTYDSMDVRPARGAIGSTVRNLNASAAPPVCAASDVDTPMGRCYITKRAASGRVACIGSSGLGPLGARVFPSGMKPSATGAMVDGYDNASTATGSTGTAGRPAFPPPLDSANGSCSSMNRSNYVDGRRDDDSSAATDDIVAAQRKDPDKASRRLATAFQALTRRVRRLGVKVKALSMF